MLLLQSFQLAIQDAYKRLLSLSLSKNEILKKAPRKAMNPAISSYFSKNLKQLLFVGPLWMRKKGF